MADDVGDLVAKLKLDIGDFEAKMAVARGEMEGLSREMNKSGSSADSAGHDWERLGGVLKIAIPIVAGLGIAVLGMTGNLGALASVLPILGTALGIILAPLTTLAAIFVGFIPPVTLLVGLLGLLGGGFALGAMHSDYLTSSLSKLEARIGILGGNLAHDFLPIFQQMVGAANQAVTYFDKLSHMSLGGAFQSLSTTGVQKLNDFVEGVAHVLAQPIRLAFQFAFGTGSSASPLAGIMQTWWTQIQQFFSGKHGVLNPVEGWFDTQHFENTGEKWGQELGHAMVMGIAHAMSGALGGRGIGMLLGGGVAGAGIGAAVGGPIGLMIGGAIGASLGLVLNHYWPEIAAKGKEAFDKVKTAVEGVGHAVEQYIGPADMAKITAGVHNIERGWEDVWSILKNVGLAVGIVVIKGAEVTAKIIEWLNEAGVFKGLINAIATIFDGLTRIGDDILRVLKDISNWISGHLQPAASAVASIFNGIASAVSSIASGLESAAHWASSIHVPSLGGHSFHGIPYAGGGVVHAAGGFMARGTDTVPAMLTPGEMVLNGSQQARLANAIFGGGSTGASGGGDLVLQVDGVTFARIARRQLLALQNVHGQSLGFNAA